jgi:hypothetical protein
LRFFGCTIFGLLFPIFIIANDTDPKQNNDNNSNPKSNRMYAAMDHHLDTITSTELVTMDNLPNDIMISHILPFIGDGNYRYIGLVNRKFRQTYTTLYPTKTTYYNGSTIALAQFCFQSIDVHQRSRARHYLCLSAARYGSIDVLTYLFPAGMNWFDDILEKTIQYGHLHVLQWLMRKPKEKRRTGFISCTAAKYGQLGIIQWVNELDCNIWKNSSVSAYAARGGHWDVLDYAANNGCRWDARTTEHIAQHGNLEVLKWARSKSNACRWDERTCASAAENGHIETLKWAYENGCPWDAQTCTCAANNGNIETLKWAITNGCPCNTDVCAILAKCGDLETLKWVRIYDCPWDEQTCTWAVQFGQTETWKWALTNGCPCSARTCAILAGNGDLESLKWARTHGCPWDKSTCFFAAKKWAFECIAMGP